MEMELWNLIVAFVIVASSNPLIGRTKLLCLAQQDGECVAPERGTCFNKNLWLGGEPNLLSVEEEEAGVSEILGSLSDDEQKEIVRSDTTMPIRYFRKTKVSR